ncbi:MAG: 2-hydroxy-3-oxopropionate reductase [Clostridia bacterium]|nr:2-hydroxy-3-oxopropionate reductase [Clostridia bacterium]
MKKIGFIGLGIMGKPMAKNLLKAGYELTVYTLESETVQEMETLGAKGASTNREVAENSEIIFTMVPNSPQVRQAVLGENGALEGMKPGSILVDTSSINPTESKAICAEVEKKGCYMIDAPVSGGEPKAIEGTLAFMCGGRQEIFDQVKDILSCMGSSVTLCGDIGAGNATKLANQIIVACNIAALSEALSLGKKMGVNPESIFHAIRGGLAGSTVMEAKAPMMLEHNFKPGFRIELHVKDLNNAMDAAETTDTRLPLTESVLEMMKTLHQQGKGGNDHSGLMEYYEQLNQFTL